MSVIVKGMKMPKTCTVCRFAGKGGYHMERVVCMFTGKNEDAEKVDRLPECPLVALPDKHGRLVDADALGKAVAGMVPYAIDDASSSAYTDGIGAAYYLIGDAPTIVEAEDSV